jgi:PAS domain S-box-containing protein
MEEADETTQPDIHLLLAGDEQSNLAHLSDLLTGAGNGRVRLDCVQSPKEAAVRLGETDYHLLLCDCDPGDGAERVWRRLQRRVPVIFLGGQGNNVATQAAIQAAACRGSHSCHRTQPCIALAILGAIETYSKERQSQSAEALLLKLRRTVEQSANLVMITDQSGVLEYVNPAFEEVTGYSQDEVIGETLGILKSDQQAGELYEEMWDTVLSGKVFHGVVMNRKKNGETFILEKSITPLRSPAGKITHFISTGRDITDQRRLESQLQQAQKMDAIGKLAGGVAHDFNNLLMVISAYAELTLDSLTAEDPLRNKIEEIITASRRAADLTRQLLAFGRQQMQSLRLLDLNAVVSDISRMLPRLIGEDIQFVFVPGRDLGTVKADPVQIEQIVMNLATNARDAMPQGGRLTIETAGVHLDEAYLQHHSMVPPGDYTLLAVSDSGQGIAREHLPHIFEPFYTTKEAGKGTGLGLATVYGIVKQSSGFIWVYSEPNLGTTFKIYLPKVSRATDAEPARLSEESPHGCETVLLVEDETAVRQSTREFLTRRGYTVMEAENGEEAIRTSREYCGPIDLMITDVVMPKLSGPALAGRLSAERPRMKVLFVSGYAENTVLRHGTIDVTTHFLAKPFCLKALSRKIREVLEAHEPIACAATSSA